MAARTGSTVIGRLLDRLPGCPRRRTASRCSRSAATRARRSSRSSARAAARLALRRRARPGGLPRVAASCAAPDRGSTRARQRPSRDAAGRGRRRGRAEAAIAAPRAGGSSRLPTDTVYGIAVALDAPGAIERLFEVKDRPPDRAIALLLADVAQAAAIGQLSPAATALGARSGRARLTLVVAQRPERLAPGGADRAAVPPSASACRTTRLRGRSPRGARATADHLGERLRRAGARDAAAIEAQLGDRIDLILDGGPALAARPRPSSTSPATQPRILREGPISAAERGVRPPRHGKIGPMAEERRAGSDDALGWARIADVDPDLWEAMDGERRRQHDKIELIASENYTFAAVMEAQGSWLTNKYAEGLPGQALLRRLRVRRHRRAARPGAGPRALPGRRARQRPAALRRPGQHGRLLQRPRAGRPDPGHEPRPRRPPDPRHGRSTSRAGCTRSTPTASREDTERIDYDALAAQAAEVRPKLIVGGRLRLSADHRLRADGRDRPRRRRAPVRRHGPHRRPRRGRRPSRARSRTPTSSRRRPTRRCAARAAG